MVTSKRVKIPLYPCYLKGIIYDDSEEIKGKYEACNGNEGGFFHCSDDYTEYVLAVKSSSGVTAISHEAEHIKNRIFYLIGYDTVLLNDEVDAYLVCWIVNFITDLYWKHKGKEAKSK